jgi:hypothetical protein
MIVKDDRREHVAVFGDRNRGHVQSGRLIQEFVDAAGTVQKGKLGMKMKMNEILISHWRESRPPPPRLWRVSPKRFARR